MAQGNKAMVVFQAGFTESTGYESGSYHPVNPVDPV